MARGSGRRSGALSIGVIADTHGLMRPEALAALAGSDLILHAGDVGREAVLHALRALAPVRVVRGNVDTGAWADALPWHAQFEVGGRAFHLLHDIAQRDAGAPGRGGVVVFGHSHKPLSEWRDGVLHFNPGSAGPRRFRLPVALGFLRLRDGEVSPEIRELDPG